MSDNKEIREIYSNGILDMKASFLNGVLHGMRVEYYSSGKKDREVPFVKGVACGISSKWYEDGSRHFLCPWKNDERHGMGIKFKY